MARLTMKVLGDPPPPGARIPAVLERIEGLDQPLELAHGPCLRFVFRPEQPEYSQREACALTSTALNEYSRLYGVVRSLLGREVARGEDIDDELRAQVGRPFTVTIDHRRPETGEAVFLEVVAVEPRGGTP